MTIVVNTHHEHEEQKLMAFLDRMNYEYSKNDDTLSEDQLSDILIRDAEFEAGQTEAFSLEEIKTYFHIK